MGRIDANKSSKRFSELLDGTVLEIPEIKLELAESTKDSDVMDKLSNDTDWRIRSRIAAKKNLNRATLEKLSKDNDYLVRLSVIQNENVDIFILKAMINDENIMVKKSAKIALQNKQDVLYSMWSDE